MSDPTLNDLNVRLDLDLSGLTPEARWLKESSYLIPARPLSPAEFDRIAREWLREKIGDFDGKVWTDSELASAVLAVLDGGQK